MSDSDALHLSNTTETKAGTETPGKGKKRERAVSGAAKGPAPKKPRVVASATVTPAKLRGQLHDQGENKFPAVGDKIATFWKSPYLKWYTGVVTAVRKEVPEVDITYDDGDILTEPWTGRDRKKWDWVGRAPGEQEKEEKPTKNNASVAATPRRPAAKQVRAAKTKGHDSEKEEPTEEPDEDLKPKARKTAKQEPEGELEEVPKEIVIPPGLGPHLVNTVFRLIPLVPRLPGNPANPVQTILISENKDEPSTIGRRTKALTTITDSFVSRIAMYCWVTEEKDGVAIKVKSSNAIRVQRAAGGMPDKLRQGEETVLRHGDIVELSYNPLSDVGTCRLKIDKFRESELLNPTS